MLFWTGCKSLDSNNTRSYWKDSGITTQGVRLPTAYRGLRLDLEKLISGFENSGEVIIPLPEGNNITVRLIASGTMSEELAKKFPEIKSYEVVKANSVTGRVNINPSGFYAMIVTIGGTYFINPIEKKGEEYLSYNKSNIVPDPNNPFIEIIEKSYKP